MPRKGTKCKNLSFVARKKTEKNKRRLNKNYFCCCLLEFRLGLLYNIIGFLLALLGVASRPAAFLQNIAKFKKFYLICFWALWILQNDSDDDDDDINKCDHFAVHMNNLLLSTF